MYIAVPFVGIQSNFDIREKSFLFMQLLFFGSLTDIAGKADFDLSKIENTDQLKVSLFEQYPELVNHSFLIAVNKKVQTGNVDLKDDDVVALMPPFSGG
ncbi:hypothetical protein BH11BAC1_BH11BAC1_01950 [soil metagenome]